MRYGATLANGDKILFDDLGAALSFARLVNFRGSVIETRIHGIVSPEDLRWYEEDKKRQEPHAV